MTFPRQFLPGTLAALLLGLAACAGSGSLASDPTPPENPLVRISDPSLTVEERVEAVEEATRLARMGAVDAEALRSQLRKLVWGPRFPLELRRAAVESLLSDPDPEVEAELKELVGLRLPTENSLTIVTELCEATAARRWDELTPAVVRSFSRPVAGVPDTDRPEFDCLRELHPGMPVEQVVYNVFIDPPEEGGPPGVPWTARTRFDAWNLLGRLDADATFIREVLREPASPDEPDPLLAAIRASVDDLRAVPRTAEELRWVASLRSGEDQADQTWWQEASEAIAGLTVTDAAWLEVRHAEPVRWAARHRPTLLEATRAELLELLAARIDGRAVHRRTERHPGKPPLRDRLSERRDELRWGDLVAILVIDEALRDPDVAEAMFVQTEMDHEDRTTEYGGVLSSGGGGGFKATLYPPRPGARKGDTQFVASQDMIDQSNRSLAHYHFHAQRRQNAEFAGPSPGDLAYAARYRRSCLVLTSLGSDLLALDYYQPNGAVIDLGELRRP